MLQTQLSKHLPAAFSQQFPQGVSIAYSAIPTISSLPEPLRTQVRVAFAQSLKVLWQVLAGIAGAGALASLAMKGLALHDKVDEKWGMEEEAAEGTVDEEKAEVLDVEPSLQ